MESFVCEHYMTWLGCLGFMFSDLFLVDLDFLSNVEMVNPPSNRSLSAKLAKEINRLGDVFCVCDRKDLY